MIKKSKRYWDDLRIERVKKANKERGGNIKNDIFSYPYGRLLSFLYFTEKPELITKDIESFSNITTWASSTKGILEKNGFIQNIKDGKVKGGKNPFRFNKQNFERKLSENFQRFIEKEILETIKEKMLKTYRGGAFKTGQKNQTFLGKIGKREKEFLDSFFFSYLMNNDNFLGIKLEIENLELELSNAKHKGDISEIESIYHQINLLEKLRDRKLWDDYEKKLRNLQQSRDEIKQLSATNKINISSNFLEWLMKSYTLKREDNFSFHDIFYEVLFDMSNKWVFEDDRADITKYEKDIEPIYKIAFIYQMLGGNFEQN